MLKKSDIQALLDRLPEEFEAETFQREFEALAYGTGFTPEEIAKIDEAEAEIREKGTIPVEQAMEKMKAWRDSRSASAFSH